MNVAIQSVIKELREEINHHNYLYHAKDDPVITDEDFDNLMRKLAELERQFPIYITPDSPTQRIGSSLTELSLNTIRHLKPMYSLDNAFTQDDIKKFDDYLSRVIPNAEDVFYVAEPKYDGMAVKLTYKNGLLVSAATRGNGEEGEDILNNAKAVSSIPLILKNAPGGSVIEVDGEIYMLKKVLQDLNAKASLDKVLSNTRNAAAGSMRNLDPSIVKERKLKFVAYGVGYYDGIDIPTNSQSGVMSFLSYLGIPVSLESKLVKGLSGMESYYQDLLLRRDNLAYDIDGVVFKACSLELQKKAGHTSRFPSFAMAYKFPAKEVITKLKDIITQVSRSGVITPVAVLEPVLVGGVTVSRSTINNLNVISNKDLRIGDMVKVRRSGDVVPEILGPSLEHRTEDLPVYQMPDKCPSCGSLIIQNENKTLHRCSNEIDCSGQLIQAVIHYCSKEGMNIDGFGDKIVTQLVESGYIKQLSDIYSIKASDLYELKGIGEKKAFNLISNISNSRKVLLDKFIYAIGVPGIGTAVSREISKYFKSFNAFKDAPYEELLNVKGIGEEVARGIVEFFQRPFNQVLLDKLVNSNYIDLQINNRNGSLYIVVTGTFRQLKRSEIEDTIHAHGNIVQHNVTRNTDYIIVGNSPGAKYEKALELDIPVITEDNFEDFINNLK